MKRIRNMKVNLVSLGCAKNRVDSEKTLAILASQGCVITDDPNLADCLLVNTCGFINDARTESINTILELAEIKKRNPSVRLAVMGCMVERFGGELSQELPEVDYLFDFSNETAGLAHKAETTARILETGAVSAYLKIAEGCGNSCSFCSIPLIRGPLKSRPVESIVAEARQLVSSGVKEIVLVAQDTSRYGADLRMKNGLVSLLREVVKTDARWVRVMYLYPTLITDEILNCIAEEEKVCHYIDVPLQHINDDVLKKMGRNENKRDIIRLVERIRKRMPQGAIRSSFIVGTPGEMEKQFRELEQFIISAELDHAGVFTYSPEEGTKSAEMSDDIPEEVKHERKERLMLLQQEISLKRNKAKVGKAFDVLVERFDVENNLLPGRLMTQAPEVDGDVILDACSARPGEIITVKISGAIEYDLIGVQT
ncbi:MAG: 30S ribosomal protein S12 methylthiotransferase RimO [Nitrospinae bacterium]|nr:30S ribosomal protein S12 methylthiotransferase RimO [Nitrospinota bacterium]